MHMCIYTITEDVYVHMYMFKHTNTWSQRSTENKRTNWVRKKDGMKS